MTGVFFFEQGERAHLCGVDLKSQLGNVTSKDRLQRNHSGNMNADCVILCLTIFVRCVFSVRWFFPLGKPGEQHFVVCLLKRRTKLPNWPSFFSNSGLARVSRILFKRHIHMFSDCVF